MKKILSLCAAVTFLAIAPSANAADIPVRGPIYKNNYVTQAPVFNWTGFYVGGHVGYGFGDDIDGFLVGAQLGYNWQFSRNIVFGVEADIAGTDINGSTGGINSHIDYLGTARARLGYVWDRTMIYGTGGFAFSRAASAGVHGNDTGYALGAGLEWAYSNAWTLKAEYMYHDLGSGFEVSTFKLGANYRFSGF